MAYDRAKTKYSFVKPLQPTRMHKYEYGTVYESRIQHFFKNNGITYWCFREDQ